MARKFVAQGQQAMQLVYRSVKQTNTLVAHRPSRCRLRLVRLEDALGAGNSRSTRSQRLDNGGVDLRGQSSVFILRLELEGESEEKTLPDRCFGPVEAVF